MKYIYALVSGQLVLYVGQTYRLKYREYCHRKPYNTSHSKYIPEYVDWTMKVLETVPDDQSFVKEQYYYDTLKPLYNYSRPGQTEREWKKSEVGKKSHTKYNQTDERKAFMKEYLKQYRLKQKEKK